MRCVHLTTSRGCTTDELASDHYDLLGRDDHDIPSQNWGPDEWAREFDTFVLAGIDTVIMIRTGYQEKLACASATIAAHRPVLLVQVDPVRLFLDLVAARDIALFFGLYDSGYHLHRNDWTVEVELNRRYLHKMPALATPAHLIIVTDIGSR